jgi:hypothetical protein
MELRRAWNGDDWQLFAFRLVQLRHGAENVQVVPDRVRGDAGIEFISMDGCLYQCYAPEEFADVAKAASAMRSKGARDLKKLSQNKAEVQELLQGQKIRRWILLCPFLDDKSVVASIRKNGARLREVSLPFLDASFEALVQCQVDFPAELERIKTESFGVPLAIRKPTDAEVDAASEGALSDRLLEKLGRAFPNSNPAEIEDQKEKFVSAHLIRENALEGLRFSHPTLWDRSVRCIESEERRLVAIGASGGLPSDQLKQSLQRIEESLKFDLPGLQGSVISDIAVGTISDWLVRCPLDFPSKVR